MSFTRPVLKSRRGLTLLELVVVVAVMAIIAGAMVPNVAHYLASSKVTAANASLAHIRDAIVGTPEIPGYLADTGQWPTTLADLVRNPFPPGNPLATFNRDSRRGWRGPYLLNANGSYTVDNTRNFTSAYGIGGDSALLDPWGNPIILQRSTIGVPDGTPDANNCFIRLVSAGPNGILDTPRDYSGTPYPPRAARGDDIVLFINHVDAYQP
ncbi:MAG: prepilin-type N-terminal cleavage/methylation domain-containing protein [Tepidisphaeraceae bacterium]